jgi:hypothetical protein
MIKKKPWSPERQAIVKEKRYVALAKPKSG